MQTSDPENFQLSDPEKLQLLQLQTVDYWSRKALCREENIVPAQNLTQGQILLPEQWNLTKNIDLHRWQKEAIEKWMISRKGIAKVVTGGGKTIFALALAQELQNAECRNLKVLIIVPTIVLLNQWYDVLCEHSNIPADFIGRLGGGFSDDFDRCAIVISVVNSAVLKLVPAMKDKYAENLFLIVDECHRLHGQVMSKTFEIRRKYSLGISATPERENLPEAVDDDSDPTDEFAIADENIEDVVKTELGDVFFELGYEKAISEGFLPEFEIHHIALPLIGDEISKYRKVSDEITDLRNALLETPGAPKGGELSGWARMKINQKRTADDLRGLCAQYVSKTAERKTLLYRAKSRKDAVIKIIQDKIKMNPNTQIILFHERINEIMAIFNELRSAGFPVVAEHSKLPDAIRAESIEAFRHGIAKIIVSGKSLIEGFDAPAADIGINVAATASQRQAIQSTGRILRKGKDNQDKTGVIYRLYIEGTTDANIYKKTDFSKIAGTGRNLYFKWNPLDESQNMYSIETGRPPFTPAPDEKELDWQNIKPGEELEMDCQGEDFQYEKETNNIYQKKFSNSKIKFYVSNGGGVAELVKKYASDVESNYFIQSKSNRIFVRIKVPDSGEWKVRYIGQLDRQLIICDDVTPPSPETKVGDIINNVPGNAELLKIVHFRGKNYIQKRLARGAINLNDPVQSEKIFAHIRELETMLNSVNGQTDRPRVTITTFSLWDKTLFYRDKGNAYFICTLEKQLDF